MNNPRFSFNFISFEQNLEEINKLNTKKASQTTDIPVPIMKGNKHVVALFIYLNFNNPLSISSFPTVLKYAEVKPVFKKMTNDKKTTDQLTPVLRFALLPYYRRCITSSILILIRFFLNCSAVFVNVITWNNT